MSRKKFSLFPEQRQDPGQVGGARWSCRGLVERAASFEGSMERESRHSASAERQVGGPAWSWEGGESGLGQYGKDKGRAK